MKDLSMLIWLTQLGLSIAAPMVCYIWLAVWLRNTFGWGNWVILAALVLGLSSAVSGFRISMKAMQRMSQGQKKQDPPPISFNDHF